MPRFQNVRDDRLFVLWTVLVWEGELRNARLQTLFSLKPVQVSRLLAEFRSSFPDAVVLDSTTKSWKLAQWEAIPPKAKNIQSYLSIVANEHGDLPEWLCDARVMFTEPQPAVFAGIRKACRLKRGLAIRYASMRHPEGTERLVFPHTVVRLGQRWHMRAWCAARKDFRDFNLGRILAITKSDEIFEGEIPEDKAWQKRITIRLVPHRQLPPSQEGVVRGEFCRGTSGRRITVPAALVHYTIQEVRAAIVPLKETPPDYLLEVANIDELRPYLFGDANSNS
jgi:hypothetical protein